MTCHCLSCDPKSGEIGLECTKERKWTTDLLKRKSVDLVRTYNCFVDLPHPSNLEYLTKSAKEYADAWCQDRAS